MKQTLCWGALGYGLTTIFWFFLGPILTDVQERIVGWLLMGAYAVVIAVALLRARRKADQRPSS